MSTPTETTKATRDAAEAAAQTARTVADQGRILADQTIEATRQFLDAYQATSVATLQASFQATNRWFEISRLMLDQTEQFSREAKTMLENVSAQSRRQQDVLLDSARNGARTFQNTWLGVYRNGRNV